MVEMTVLFEERWRLEDVMHVGEEQDVMEIVATVAEPAVELERRVAELEGQIRALMAQTSAAHESAGRKTAKTFSVAAKGEAMEAGALDAAFASLSVEQRIAVKMEMMRSGLLG
ncbi:MAG: hypothetical protein JSS87_01830 [Acidobacteria bacterium]|nr:hypothetical protein [Acidobacteriota bacterium]